MSLKEAVLTIADAMTTDPIMEVEAVRSDMFAFILRSYANQLRAACTAVDDQPQPQSVAMGHLLYPPEVQHRLAIDEARKEFRKAPQEAARLEERWDGDMVRVQGGPVDPDNTPAYQSVDPTMPLGAFMTLAGGVYRLVRDDDGTRSLRYDAEQTQTLRQRSQTP